MRSAVEWSRQADPVEMEVEEPAKVQRGTWEEVEEVEVEEGKWKEGARGGPRRRGGKEGGPGIGGSGKQARDLFFPLFWIRT